MAALGQNRKSRGEHLLSALLSKRTSRVYESTPQRRKMYIVGSQNCMGHLGCRVPLCLFTQRAFATGGSAQVTLPSKNTVYRLVKVPEAKTVAMPL